MNAASIFEYCTSTVRSETVRELDQAELERLGYVRTVSASLVPRPTNVNDAMSVFNTSNTCSSVCNPPEELTRVK